MSCQCTPPPRGRASLPAHVGLPRRLALSSWTLVTASFLTPRVGGQELRYAVQENPNVKPALPVGCWDACSDLNGTPFHLVGVLV